MLMFVLIGLGIIGIAGVVMGNKLRYAQVKVEEASSGIDVALEKRYDSLVKMLALAKSYGEFEKEAVTDIVKVRAGMTMDEKSQANSNMEKLEKTLSIVAEQYPELKANEQFVLLQKQIVDVEEHLQAARRAYNANVTSLNSKLVMFPTSVIGSMLHIQKELFFEAEDQKRGDVAMNF